MNCNGRGQGVGNWEWKVRNKFAMPAPSSGDFSGTAPGGSRLCGIPYTESCRLMPAYCEVALPVPLDRTFTYAVRDGQRPRRGARVIVPFRNEKLIGVVISLGDVAPADYEVRYLEAVLDEDTKSRC